MKKIHFSIVSHNISASIEDYSKRFAQQPCVVIDNEYVLWRTQTINFSIRYDELAKPGTLRHLGWEDDSAPEFSSDKDINNVVWERFSSDQQYEEIKALWPNAIM